MKIPANKAKEMFAFGEGEDKALMVQYRPNQEGENPSFGGAAEAYLETPS